MRESSSGRKGYSSWDLHRSSDIPPRYARLDIAGGRRGRLMPALWHRSDREREGEGEGEDQSLGVGKGCKTPVLPVQGRLRVVRTLYKFIFTY